MMPYPYRAADGRESLARRLAGGRGGRGGQALVLVVLLMMAVILVGVLFVSVVSFNQESSQRMGDLNKATQLAEAGLNYANYMLTYSPEGADWRPPFRPYDPLTYNPSDPDTWPIPPVYLGNPSAPPSTWIATPNLFGPDGIQFTDDDYYMEEEVTRGWAGLVNTAPPGAPGPSAPYYVRLGYSRYPDPNNAGSLTGGPLDQLDISQGHFLLRITYDPDPPFEGGDVASAGGLGSLQPDARSKYLKIESVGVVAGTNFVWKRLVAYKAIGLTDYLLWVTDRDRTGRPALLGFGPWTDLDNTGTIWNNTSEASVDRRGDFLVARFEGPMRFNCPVELRGDNADLAPSAGSPKNEALGSTQINLLTAPQPFDDPFAWRPYGGGYLRDDRFEAYGIREGTMSADAAGGVIPGQSTTVNLISSTGTTSRSLWDSSDPRFNTYGGRVLDNQRSDNPNRNALVDPLNPPDIFQTDPATGQTRYHALTRDSGPVVRNTTTGETVHVGRYGHGPGVYIDNFGDVQFVGPNGVHDIEALIEDLLGNMSPTDRRASDSGWNATRTMYVPKGVEITLYHTEAAALEYGRLTPVTTASPGTIAPNEVWWPNHVAGEPGIKITRHDQRWRIADPNNADTLGQDSGVNVMCVDYPPPGNQVIFAEGNVRVKGILPRDPSGTGRYNLTIVSGGTIYIDGQILSPQDLEGRFTPQKGTGCPDEENSYLALLARDCVVINPTQIVPVLTQGMVIAAPDDPTAPLASEQHWQLSPTLGGSIYSRWWFGEPPVTGGNPNLINLVAYQTGEDPGPAGISLWLFNSQDNTAGYYDFDPNSGNPVLSKFLFVPPGLVPPAPNVAETLSPLWQPLASGPNPNLPWPLNGSKAPPAPLNQYVSTVPGDLNSFEFRYADPGLGGGGTNYWLKKFKIEELDPNNGLPKGAVHAKVNALMYAQDGCFFIIPGPYFDASATGANAARFRRFNYDLEIRGAIAENFHASPAAWREWQDHWAYPQYFDSGGTPTLAWGTIRYRYDETLLANREEPATQITGALRYASAAPATVGTNLPKLPLLPTCPGLIYHGTGP